MIYNSKDPSQGVVEMILYKPYTFLGCILFLASSLNTPVSAKQHWDGPWKDTTSPSLNVYKFLKNFSNQKTRSYSMGEGVGDKYYQNGKYVGWTHFATSAWFKSMPQDSIRKRLKRVIRSVPSVTMDDVREITTGEAYAVYIEKNGCVYLSFYTRAKDTGADNDYGDPDTTGVFKTCEGLTVPADQFINQILEAEEEDKVAFSAAVSSKSPVTRKSTPSPTSVQSKASDQNALERLRKLKKLLESDLITENEFERKKQEILSAM